MKTMLFKFLKITLLFVVFAVFQTAKAQAPQKMTYQAVFRDNNNALITSSFVGMRISILQGSATGMAVYTETQTGTTNSNGLISIEIGAGVPVLGTFASIKWAAGPYFIKTETDPTGGTSYFISGTNQLLSVPYALYAENGPVGATGPQGPQGLTGANGLDGAVGATGPEGPQGITGVGFADGDKGDITISATATSLMIDDNTITTTKLVDNAVTVSKLPLGATNTTYLRGDGTWSTPSTTDVTKLAITNNLSDLNNATTARTNLGLGTLATQSGTFSGTSSGTNTGDQDLSGLVPYTGAISDVNLGVHNFTVDTNTLFVDSVNHRLGIGTATPSQLLTVGNYGSIGVRSADDGFVNNGEPEVEGSGLIIMKGVGTNRMALYDYKYGESLSFRNDAHPRLEIHGYSPWVNKYKALLNIALDEHIGSIQVRNPSTDGNSIIIGMRDDDSEGVIFTETNNSDITITPNGTGQINLRKDTYVTGGGVAIGNGYSIPPPSNGLIVEGFTGIGLNNPVYPLDVDGQIAINGVIIASKPTGMTGSSVYGTGGNNISHSAGIEGYYNTFTGVSSGSLNTTGYGNTTVGASAMEDNTVGYKNTLIGAFNSQKSTTANNNSGFGYASLFNNLTGSNNTVSGAESLYNNSTGSNNVVSGYQSLYQNLSATSTTAIGVATGYGTTGYSNQGGTYIGYQAGYGANTGSDYNTLIGYNAGYGITTGTRNTILGNSTVAGSIFQITTGSNNISIGNDVAVPNATSSNQLSIGNLIYGTGLNGTGATVSNGKIGIGTKTPTAKLVVNSGELLINTNTNNGVDKLQVNGSILSAQYKLSGLNTAPTSATATGVLGEIRVTAGYIYVCIATNTWVRSVLSTF